MAEAPSERIANCPNPDCKSPILSNHPNPWCTECGERLPEDIQLRLSRVQETRTRAAAAVAQLQRADAPQPVEVAGRALQCVICRHDHFFSRVVDSTMVVAAAILGAHMSNVRGTYHVCAECGYVHW